MNIVSSLPENGHILALMQSTTTVASMGEDQSGKMPGLQQHENVTVSAVPMVLPERQKHQICQASHGGILSLH